MTGVSTSRSFVSRRGYALALLVATAACGEAVTESPVGRAFDRPVDVAFGCWGKLRIDGQPVDAATNHPQPLGSCGVRVLGNGDASNLDPVPPGQEGVRNANLFWYSVAVQPTSGTITVVNYKVKGIADESQSYNESEFSVEDSDPLTPGQNSLAVGSGPIAIDTDTAGCHLLTANTGTCDLSVIDLDRLVTNADGVVSSRSITAGGQPLLARPAAMAAVDLASPIGVACPADPIGIHYIAYPDCHAVAAVDAATGEVVASIRFGADGTATLGDGALICPRQCGERDPIIDGARPVALDIVRDDRVGVGTQKLAIALDNRPVATVVTLDVGGLPTTVQQIDLEGDIGTIDVALSKQITMGGVTDGLNDGAGDGDEAQFAYLVATDRTVRVVELLGAGVECDTQVDPRYLEDERNSNRLICLGVGQIGTPPRRVGVTGPGIVLPGAGRPVSVAIGSANNKRATGGIVDPAQLAGHFAYIALSNGFTIIANIDDDNIFDTHVVAGDDNNAAAALVSQVPLVLPHQLRDNVTQRGTTAVTDHDNNANTPAIRTCSDPGPTSASGAPAGSPHADSLPLRVIPGALSSNKGFALPYFHQSVCVGGEDNAMSALPDTSFAATNDVRLKTFPDLMMVSDEDWFFTWEGQLSRDRSDGASVIDGPVIRTGVLDIGGGGISMTDPGLPFCAAGVEPRDIVTLRGCDPARGDAQCSVGETCYSHPDATVATGACLPIDRADDLASVCRDYLVSVRRYSVVETFAGRLTLRERARELRTTPIDGCTSDTQCQDLARYDASLVADTHPFEDTTPASSFTYGCRADPYRSTAPNRCVMTCERDAQCADGTLCRAGRCIEGVVPSPECAAGLQRYDLRASEAFVAIGSVSGYRHPIVADPSGRCIVNPTANVVERGRIPLAAPPCTGTGPDGPTPNPCSVTVDQTELVANYVPGTCNLVADATSRLITRSTQGIRFRNAGMDLTLVDPTYPGDAMCRNDRGGSLVNVPTVMPALELRFHVDAGFQAKLAGDAASQPVNVVRAPDGSLWVVDAGDIRNSSTDLRGQLIRVSPMAPASGLHIQ